MAMGYNGILQLYKNVPLPKKQYLLCVHNLTDKASFLLSSTLVDKSTTISKGILQDFQKITFSWSKHSQYRRPSAYNCPYSLIIASDRV